MDGKLARGYAREGRRHDQRHQELLVLVNSVVDERAGLEIEVRRKISSRRLKLLAETVESLRHNLVFLRLGQAMPGWGSSTKVQISGSFVPQVVRFEGRLEKASRYRLEVKILSRRSYDRRQEEKIFFIREHAFKRYIERSNAKYDDLFGDLWPAVLLPTLMKMIGASVSQQIALPVKDGMFLGTYSGACRDGMSVVDRKGHVRGRPIDDVRLNMADEPAIWVHTYISFDEMSDQQAALWLALTRFLNEHAEAMIDWHALGPLTHAFKDDPLEVWPNIACPDDVLRKFRRIYAGAVWRRTLGSHQHHPSAVPSSSWVTRPGRVSLPTTFWEITLPPIWSRKTLPRPTPVAGMKGVYAPR